MCDSGQSWGKQLNGLGRNGVKEVMRSEASWLRGSTTVFLHPLLIPIFNLAGAPYGKGEEVVGDGGFVPVAQQWLVSLRGSPPIFVHLRSCPIIDV